MKFNHAYLSNRMEIVGMQSIASTLAILAILTASDCVVHSATSAPCATTMPNVHGSVQCIRNTDHCGHGEAEHMRVHESAKTSPKRLANERDQFNSRSVLHDGWIQLMTERNQAA